MTGPLTCSQCGQPKRARRRETPTGGLSHILYCPCRQRGYAASWIARNPDKRAAHRAVEKAIRRGNITRHPCEVCGSADSEGHHEDYAAPLDVTWLCPKHHSERHKTRSRTR